MASTSYLWNSTSSTTLTATLATAQCYNIQYIEHGYPCSRGIILPFFSEFTWSTSMRAAVYMAAMLWTFVGIAIVSDVLMIATERVTMATRMVRVRSKGQPGEGDTDRYVEVRVWNDTVANLTLMAVGSTAPEILLTVIEVIGSGFKSGDLGPSTVIGSSAFNLFWVMAACILALPPNETRNIKAMNVFFITSSWSVLAYLWLIVMLEYISPNEVHIWEALVTLLLFPALVLLGYAADRIHCKHSKVSDSNTTILVAEAKATRQKLAHFVVFQSADENLKTYKQKEFGDSGKVATNAVAASTTVLATGVGFRSRSLFRNRGVRQLFSGGYLKTLAETVQLPVTSNQQKTAAFETTLSTVDTTHAVVELTEASLSVSKISATADVKIGVRRSGKMDVDASVRLETVDCTAVAGKDYTQISQSLTFLSGEQFKEAFIKVMGKSGPDISRRTLFVKLVAYEGLPTPCITVIGKQSICQVVLCDRVGDESCENDANPDIGSPDAPIKEVTWRQQFRNAMLVNNGDIASATSADYIIHLFTFFWKVMAATVPPPSMLGGYPAFGAALVLIGVQTALIGDMASIFGCLTGLGDIIMAITFIAVGTSLPDLLASRQVALHEKTADNAIGNITGSNCVNVFLGLGVPWTIASIYSVTMNNTPFQVSSAGLTFSVFVYTTTAVVGIAVILFRHYVYPKADLGGPMMSRWTTSILFIGLWLIFIVLSVLQEFKHLPDPF